MSQESDEGVLLFSLEQGGVALLRLNRPAAKNALNLELRQALAARFLQLSEDPAVRCIVIAGNGDTFAAGADVRLLAEKRPAEVAALAFEKLWEPIERCPKPVIAAVNGFALGAGCELAMHADLIVAGEGARFGLPEVKLGIMPGAGGTQRLLRAVGKFAAMRLVLTGELFSGARAYEIGLASELVPDAEVLPRALALAQTIAALPPMAVAQIKSVMLNGADLPLTQAMALERRSFQLLFDTADQKEGMRAFLDKRAPQFQGR